MHNPRAVQWHSDCASQFSNWGDIKVVKMVHCNWSDNHCNWSDTQPSTTTALQANILLPSLSSTHTRTHARTCTRTRTHTHSLSLSLCCIFSSSLFLRTGQTTMSDRCWFHFRYMLILSGKILEITGHCMWYLCVYVSVCVDESLSVCVHVCVCVCVHVSASVSVCACMHVCVCET